MQSSTATRPTPWSISTPAALVLVQQIFALSPSTISSRSALMSMVGAGKGPIHGTENRIMLLHGELANLGQDPGASAEGKGTLIRPTSSRSLTIRSAFPSPSKSPTTGVGLL